MKWSAQRQPNPLKNLEDPKAQIHAHALAFSSALRSSKMTQKDPYLEEFSPNLSPPKETTEIATRSPPSKLAINRGLDGVSY